MGRTTMRSVDFRRLESKGKGAAILIRLMMACNDLQCSNEAYAEWSKPQSLARKDRQQGARMYFVRLQISHLSEAFKIIQKIHKTPELMEMVRQTDDYTQNRFNELLPYINNGSRVKWFTNIVTSVRNSLGFHYDHHERHIERAIKNLASRPVSRSSTMTRGSTAYLWYFKPGDDIVDEIVVRQLWEVPLGSDLAVEIDHITEEIHSVIMQFVGFASEFIWKHSTS